MFKKNWSKLLDRHCPKHAAKILCPDRSSTSCRSQILNKIKLRCLSKSRRQTSSCNIAHLLAPDKKFIMQGFSIFSLCKCVDKTVKASRGANQMLDKKVLPDKYENWDRRHKGMGSRSNIFWEKGMILASDVQAAANRMVKLYSKVSSKILHNCIVKSNRM